MSYAGVNNYFALATSVTGTPEDVSDMLDGVTPSSSTEELDGTTFQPGVDDPIKDIVNGFSTKGISLSIKWTPEAEAFFSGVAGKKGLPYEHGPLGNDAGMTKISGTCNVLSYSGPVTTVSGIITATAELRVRTRTVDTF